MKKRTAFIGAILSLIPLGHPLIIKTGVVLSTTGLMLSVSENVYAKDASFYINRGIDKHGAGDFYGAISDYNKAIKLKPNDALSYVNRGVSKNEKENYQGALKDYDKAIELNPLESSAYANRGVTKHQLEDYYGAISDYTKAIKLLPSYPYSYVYRGTLKKDQLNDLKGACIDLNKALDLGYENYPSWVKDQC